MPGLNGLEIAERVAKESPEVRMIVLSMHATESYVADALRAGVVGYLRKSAAVAELPAAIEAVSRGEIYLSPGISRDAIEALLSEGAPPSPLAGLSPRQREILQLIAEGHSSKEIGFRLGISSKTVDTHRAQIMERLGIHNIQGLVKFAMRAGLVPEE
jgi:DNA-binding NarL/FixJ family response regulator